MEQNNLEESIDIKKWLFLASKNWYLYVIIFPIFFIATLIYKRYADNVYNIKSSVLVKMTTMGGGLQGNAAFYSAKLNQKNLTNEINIIK